MMTSDFIIDCAQYRESLLKLAVMITTDYSLDRDAFFAETSLVADELPLIIRQKLYDFHLKSNTEGVILFKNMLVDANLPSTPNCAQDLQKNQYLSEICLAMIGSRLGYVIGYQQERGGALIQDLFPVKSEEDEKSGSGSLLPLDFHTEKHFHPHKPDYLLLYCLRADERAQTYYVNVSRILSHIDDEQKSLLFKPVFRGGIDYSFGSGRTTKGRGDLTPVLYGHLQAPYLNYDSDLMVGVTPEAEQLFGILGEITSREKQAVSLAAGDLLILDNKQVIHARSPFNPRYDGTDRWLQRAYIKTDLSMSASDRELGSCVIKSAVSLII